MLSIQALLSAPNPDDPLSENIAKHWKTNEAEAVETGKIMLLLLHLCLAFVVLNYSQQIVKSGCLDSVLSFSPWFFLWTVSDNAAKEWTRLYASGA